MIQSFLQLFRPTTYDRPIPYIHLQMNDFFDYEPIAFEKLRILVILCNNHIEDLNNNLYNVERHINLNVIRINQQLDTMNVENTETSLLHLSSQLNTILWKPLPDIPYIDGISNFLIDNVNQIVTIINRTTTTNQPMKITIEKIRVCVCIIRDHISDINIPIHIINGYLLLIIDLIDT